MGNFKEMKFRVCDNAEFMSLKIALYAHGYQFNMTPFPRGVTEDSMLTTYENGYMYLFPASEQTFNSHPNKEHMLKDGKLVCKEDLKPDTQYISVDTFVDKLVADIMPVTAPPIGLRPKRIVERERILEILEAMHRYAVAGVQIPLEWTYELCDLLSGEEYVV